MKEEYLFASSNAIALYSNDCYNEIIEIVVNIKASCRVKATSQVSSLLRLLQYGNSSWLRVVFAENPSIRATLLALKNATQTARPQHLINQPANYCSNTKCNFIHILQQFFLLLKKYNYNECESHPTKHKC